jgi:hypothetical protein
MADDRHYVGGDNYLLDDLSGFKIRASRAKRIPGGQTGNLMVDPKRWEEQQPQDFVRGIPDMQNADILRPRQQDQFTVVGSNIAAPSLRGQTNITVASARGFTEGMQIQIMLDNGENFVTTLMTITGLVFGLAAPLPFSVGLLYGDPPENLVLALTP